MTAAIRDFQRTHLDHEGKALKVDGVRGPRTEWAEDFETLCAARRNIITEAQQYIGLTEDPVGSNSDPGGFIRGWLARCFARAGDPWCAAFASYCLSAGLATQVREASAQRLGKRFPPTSLPVVGDLFWYPTGPVRGHVGLVLGVAPHEVMTLEGNCDNAVRVVRRDRAELRFSVTVEDTSGTCPGVIPDTPRAPTATR